jgi:hypothetical protein
VLWAFQDALIYFPATERPAPPAAHGLRGVEEVSVRTEDGLDLLAWMAAPARAGAPVILYLHGNGGSLAHRAGRLREFQSRGWGALFLQWRGYGGNAGSPGEAGLALDAHAALSALQARGVPPGRTVLWGESLGTGPAVRLAAERPASVAAVVLQSPYTSLLDLARLHYPVLPSGLLLRDRYDSLSRIAEVRAPVLVLLAGQDTLVPPAMGRRLAEAVRAPVEVVEQPLAGHNTLDPVAASDAAAAFLARHLR